MGKLGATCGRWLAVLLLVGTVAATTGCGRTTRNSVPRQIASSGDWIDVNSPTRGQHVALRATDCPRNVLALSGGGSYGAFSAGLLNGWTETGARPTFDVVTGISTGALIATFAFLGPQYDAELKRLFTTISDRDIYRRRGPLAPLRAESVVSNVPLKRLIESQITPEVVAQVTEAHARGRRLYVATTNLDTRRLVVWDMGAIATRGDVPLYVNVLLASASIPGFFPPVSIVVEVNGRRFTEPHVDGGVSAQVFVQRFMLAAAPAEGPQGDKGAANSTVWVVTAGKLYGESSRTGTRTLEIGMSAINTLLNAHTRNDIRRVATVAKETNSHFRLTAIPDDFPIDPSPNFFDPVVMGKLFDIGFTLGRSGSKAWRNTPPEADDVQDAPRTGTQFIAPEPIQNGPPMR
ncbi:MAG: patatin-like phospholipase family protein [Planctomycetes bacterium]|nr:patatin-like phospholipase family protein [Planctomycetota bacterium]